MLNQPMSSPMITMMLGFCCAAAGEPAAITAASSASAPSQSLRMIFMVSNDPLSRERTVTTCRSERRPAAPMQPHPRSLASRQSDYLSAVGPKGAMQFRQTGVSHVAASHCCFDGHSDAPDARSPPA